MKFMNTRLTGWRPWTSSKDADFFSGVSEEDFLISDHQLLDTTAHALTNRRFREKLGSVRVWVKNN